MTIFYAQSGAPPGGNGSLAAPFNNLGTSWPGVAPGDTVRLLAGSVFRESFTALDVAGLTLEGWGSGPLPVVSGANIVTDWTPVGGGIFSWSAGSNICGNVAIEGEPMLWKAWAGSLGATALEPGAFTFDYAGFVLYIRPADGIVTDRLISVSVRPQLIDANTVRDGFTLRNVRFEQASRHAVAILNRTNWLVEDIEIWLAGGMHAAGSYMGNGVEVASGANDGTGRRIKCWHIFDSAVTSQLYNGSPQSLLRNTWEDVTAYGAGLAACEFTLLQPNQTMADMVARRITARGLGSTGWLALRTGVDSYGVGAVNNGGTSSTMDGVTVADCNIEATRYGLVNSSATNGATNFTATGNKIRGIGSLSDTEHQGVRLVNGSATLQRNVVRGFWAGVSTAGGNTFSVTTSNNHFISNFRHFFRNAANAGFVSNENVLQGSTQIYGTNFAGGFTGTKNYRFNNTETGPEYSSSGDVTLSSGAVYPPGTLYAVIYPSFETDPVDDEVIGGFFGVSVWNGSTTAPSIAGAFDWPSIVSTLAPGTSYKAAFCWSDGTNKSNVAVSSEFTTASGDVTLAAAALSRSAATAALTTAISLQASAASRSTASAALTSSIAMAATAAAKSTAAAALTSSINLAATAAAKSTAGATLTTAITLAAAAASKSTATAALAVPAGLEAAAVSRSTATASLTTSILLAAAATAKATTTASLSTAVQLAASASASATATASLATAITFQASAASRSTATADIATPAGLQAAATSRSTATAALSTAIALQASAAARASAGADLASAITLSAAAAARSQATAGLATSINLAAAAVSSSTATASLLAGSGLSAAAVSRSSATAALSSAITMAASAPARSTATAALATSIALSAAPTARASATAAIATSITLAAAAQSSSTATANLTTGDGTLAAAAASRSSATAALQTGISLAANAAARATATAQLGDATVNLYALAASRSSAAADLSTAILLRADAFSRATALATISGALYVTPCYAATGAAGPATMGARAKTKAYRATARRIAP